MIIITAVAFSGKFNIETGTIAMLYPVAIDCICIVLNYVHVHVYTGLDLTSTLISFSLLFMLNTRCCGINAI